MLLFFFLVPPGPPIDLNITGSKSSVLLEWLVPRFTGGMAIHVDRYIVSVQPSDKAGSCSGGNCTSESNSITVSDIRVNTNYTFSVSAVNCAGIGNSSEEEHYTYALVCK